MLVVLPMNTPSVGIFQYQGDPRGRVAALHDSDSASASPASSVRSASNASPPPAAGDVNGAKRPRRARCRWSASAKLPKMNNSERGKFYRKKYKDYEQQLERDVLALRARVRELALLAELRRQLRDELRVHDAGAVASAALERLDALKMGADACDAPLVEWVGRGRTLTHRTQTHNRNHSTHGTHQRRHDGEDGDDRAAATSTTATRFELSALLAVGSADAPVVVMVGRLRVFRLSSPAGASNPERNPPSDEEEVAAYPCTYRLLFSADCAQHELLADVDVVKGLCAPLRRLDLVAHAARRISEARNPSVPRDDLQDVKLVTASLASASLKPGRLPGVHQLLRVAAQHSDGYSSAGTVGTDSSSGSLGASYHGGRRRSVEAPARLMSAAPTSAVKAEPGRLEGVENKRRWPLLRLGKRQRAMTMDYILS